MKSQFTWAKERLQEHEFSVQTVPNPRGGRSRCNPKSSLIRLSSQGPNKEQNNFRE